MNILFLMELALIFQRVVQATYCFVLCPRLKIKGKFPDTLQTLYNHLRKLLWTQSLNFFFLSLPRVYFLFLKLFSYFQHNLKIFDGTKRLKTLIFHHNQVYLRLKSKQSIDMAGPCSILMDFDYTKAKLCKIRPFSSYFCVLCSDKTRLYLL